MGAKLVAYEHVPLGFEIVIENADVEMRKIWNLWYNVKLTDDPESWDSEIYLINKMQARLGKLTVDQRLIRAQVAEFCRLCPLFPRSIELLCKEIGDNRFSNPAKIGCEGRGLLDSLGYHNQASLNEQQKEILSCYVSSLKKWLGQRQPTTPTEFKIFGFLGKLTDSKVTLVEKLVRIADSDNFSVSSFLRLTGDVCKKAHKDFQILARTSYLGRPFNCFKCLSNEGDFRKCQCCYSMLLDSSLLCAGSAGQIKLMLAEFRRFVEENILLYSVAINSWLKEDPLKHATWLKKARYVLKKSASRTVERVHSFLGEKDEAKEWLAACLLKTIKDNQRWHRRTELIGEFPEATAWLREQI